jgi:predicted CoA-substrate-specific enzyme activase
MVGADVTKNEITAHAVAACHTVPSVHTVLEIGGQDSKIIFLRDGVVCDFAMNTVCAAGTGSFLDRQASRLSIPIEEFGSYALKAKCPVRIAGRCAVFAESDMISKQQTGHSNEDIIAGLCAALVRNYLNNLAKGKKIGDPVIFQGGVAANVGIVAAFEQELKTKLIIPQHYDVMGAYGVAILAKESLEISGQDTKFCGFDTLDNDFSAQSFACSGCPNMCEVVQIKSNGEPLAYWGDRCGKWGSICDANENQHNAYSQDVYCTPK